MHFSTMLNEICKISTVKATAALSRLLKTPLGVEMDPVDVRNIDKIDFNMRQNERIVSLYIPIKGNISGGSFLHYSEKAAFAICDTLLSREAGSTKSFTEVEKSALTEVANIVIGNFLTPFSRSLLTSSLLHSSAVFEHDASPVVLKNMRSTLLKNMGKEAVINIFFSYQHANIQGQANIVLEEKKVDKMLTEVISISNG